LVALLLPALQNARENARLVVCSSNLRQVFGALQHWTDDFNGYMICDGIPANYGWNGRCGPGNYWSGYTWCHTWVGGNPYIKTRYIPTPLLEPNHPDRPRSSVLACPSYDLSKESYIEPGSTWFLYNPSYGWNYGGLGNFDPPALYFNFRRLERVTDPARTLGFADSTYGYVVQPLPGWPGGWPNPRHNGKANVAWLDGHASPLHIKDLVENDPSYFIWRGNKDLPFGGGWN